MPEAEQLRKGRARIQPHVFKDYSMSNIKIYIIKKKIYLISNKKMKYLGIDLTKMYKI